MLGTILSVHLLIVEARLSIKLRQKVESDGEEVWAGRLKLVPSSGLWALKESWWGGLRGAPCDRCERVKKPLRSPGWVEWLRGQFIRKWLMWTMEISSSPWRKKGGSSFKFSWELSVGLGGLLYDVWWKWEYDENENGLLRRVMSFLKRGELSSDGNGISDLFCWCLTPQFPVSWAMPLLGRKILGLVVCGTKVSVDLKTICLQEKWPSVYLLLNVIFLRKSATLLKINRGTYFHMFLLKVCLCKCKLLAIETCLCLRASLPAPRARRN